MEIKPNTDSTRKISNNRDVSYYLPQTVKNHKHHIKYQSLLKNNSISEYLKSDDLYENLDFVKYVVKTNRMYKPSDYNLWKCCYKASLENNSDFLKFCLRLCTKTSDMTKQSVEDGNVEFLKFMVENGCPFDKESCISASYNNNIDCLKYLHQNGCPWDKELCQYAASNNSFDCLKYLHQNGCPWDEETCLSAVLNDSDSIKCLEYAHKNGCPWNEQSACQAAISNSVNCLKYLLDNNCPMEDATGHAAEYGNLDCLVLLNESKIKWDEDTIECCIHSFENECLKYVLDNNAPCSNEMLELSAKIGNLEALEILHSRGFKFGENFCKNVIEDCDDYTLSVDKCLKFAISNGCSSDYPLPEINHKVKNLIDEPDREALSE